MQTTYNPDGCGIAADSKQNHIVWQQTVSRLIHAILICKILRIQEWLLTCFAVAHINARVLRLSANMKHQKMVDYPRSTFISKIFYSHFNGLLITCSKILDHFSDSQMYRGIYVKHIFSVTFELLMEISNNSIVLMC